MKKLLLIGSLFFVLLSEAVAQAPAAVPVTSPNTRYQLEREVMTRWNRFNPRWYFVLFHNKYRTGPDRRNMKQLIPLMGATKITAVQSEQEDEDVTVIRDQEMYKMADRSLNKSYHLLYKSKLDGLNTKINALNLQAITAGVDLTMLAELKAEQERINTDIELTKDSYEDDSKKAEQFRKALTDLDALRGYYLRLITLYNKLPKK